MLEEDAVALKKASITALAPSSLRLENTTKCLEDYAKENHDDDDDVDVNADGDSYGSMETLSDTVSITIDGEKHWVSGIDAKTTCADLISALLQYQDLEGKQLSKHQGNQISMQTKEEQAQLKKQEASGLRNSHAYVIVKQLRHCNFEEYLDGSTRLLDVVPLRDSLGKKVCELQLRNLARTTTTTTTTTAIATTVTAATPALLSTSRGGKNPTQNPQNQHHNQMFSMLSMSTDKDSGMGSPMGSSRSERFRRRRDRGKAMRGSVAATVATTVATTMLDVVDDAQANPKQVNPNERLMHIILAQDETINRQMSLLNEKEQQILQIEDEKHRVRERELGKNYLLDAYLKTMDKPVDAGEEQPSRQRIPKLAKAELGNSSHLPDDMQVYWLEKVYALNKLLQREEEQLLRLHAKVRKQQLRHAYHTKGEVLQQIDRLDTELAEQVTDIYRVERQLLTANEQLKAKLGVLECLGKEFEVPQEIVASSTSMQHYRASIEKQDDVVWHQNCRQHRLDKDLTRKQMFGTVDQPVRAAAISSSMDIQHLGTLV